MRRAESGLFVEALVNRGVKRSDAVALIELAAADGTIMRLERENVIMRQALQDIVLASRDDGLASMIHFMRNRASAVLLDLSADS
jgi:sulfur transfer protein SufE